MRFTNHFKNFSKKSFILPIYTKLSILTLPINLIIEGTMIL